MEDHEQDRDAHQHGRRSLKGWHLKSTLLTGDPRSRPFVDGISGGCREIVISMPEASWGFALAAPYHEARLAGPASTSPTSWIW